MTTTRGGAKSWNRGGAYPNIQDWTASLSLTGKFYCLDLLLTLVNSPRPWPPQGVRVFVAPTKSVSCYVRHHGYKTRRISFLVHGTSHSYSEKKISPHWPNFRNSEIRLDRIGLTSWIVNITSYNSFEIWPIMRTLIFGRTNDIPGIRQIPSQLFCHVIWSLALDADTT